MGTNYYLEHKVCESCGKSEEREHIGKSSAGWKFLFQSTTTIKTFRDWQEKIYNHIENGGKLVDEYGREHTQTYFWNMVTSKQLDTGNKDQEQLETSHNCFRELQ